MGILAVLLPVTSRGQSEEALVCSLRKLHASLPSPEDCAIFIGVDDDDCILTSNACISIFSRAFPSHFAADRLFIHTFPATKPAKICHITNTLAMAAYNHQVLHCEWFLLLGDDVTISCFDNAGSWLNQVKNAFRVIQRNVEQSHENTPKNFGVVALNDTSLPGFPTFPVVGRTHIDIFGHLFPPDFINQDADPYLWELYRPFGARLFVESVVLYNAIGGDEANTARYDRHHIDWKHSLLAHDIAKIASALRSCNRDIKMLTTIDVIVPTFRGDEELLRGIVTLSVPDLCDVRYIIIVDNPEYKHIRSTFQHVYGNRVLVRVNDCNMGASYSRNRGLSEATATWVLFLDDDVL